MAPAPTVSRVLKHIMQQYIKRHGKIHLLPKQKEPLTRAMIEGILSLPHGTAITPKITVDHHDYFWIALMALIALMASTGQRKSEALLPDGEAWDLSRAARSQFQWKLADGTYTTDPTAAQLNALCELCFLLWVPGCSKADYTSQQWANKPSIMRFHPTATLNAPRLVAKMELRFMVHGTDRERTPMFTTKPKASAPMKYSHVEKLLQPMLVASGTVTSTNSHLYSWHSFRIWLACALKAAGASDTDILRMLRWKSLSSLHTYVMMKQSTQLALLESGMDAAYNLDVRRSANIYADLPPLDDDELATVLHEIISCTDAMDDSA